MDGNLRYQGQTQEESDIAKQLFKKSDKILSEFSKSPHSWEIVFEVLKMPSSAGVTDSQYFQAANIIKNKLKIDYVTVKGSNEAVESLKMNMMNILTEFAS